MKTLLAIDPGNNAGGAVFIGYQLLAAGLLSRGLDPFFELKNWFGPGDDYACILDEIVIELPRIIRGPGGQTEGKDPNDLIKLAFGAGRLVERFPHIQLRTVSPSDWKGGVPKRVHNLRVAACLTEDELALIPKLSPTLVHNVIDAIGIGLEHLGRMTRGAVR